MMKRRNSHLPIIQNNNFFKHISTLFSIMISIFLFISVISGVACAADDNNGNAGLGWILFYITLVVLIIIVILWVVTYFIMRGVIARLESDSSKIRRFEHRKDTDEERNGQEKDRDRRRRARSPSGNCIGCNRKFIPGSDAYHCECGKFIHVHCLSDLSLCPHCGRDIDKDYGIVRLESSRSGRTASETASRTKIRRLIKAKFCPVCNKIIKAGDTGMECDNCRAVFHEKCSEKTRVCPKCGE